ncbi:MAG: hypothetical protein HWE22_16770 [Flavobacteriales bacterium]|nr:hypothetical protein [Flavobacteriales bacterium]
MDAGPTLFIALGITLMIAVGIQIGLYNMRKRQKLVYPELWKEFETAVKNGLHTDIISVGNKLIYNKYLRQEHLTIIHQTAIKLEKEHIQFKSLRLNAYNKQLHYDRPLPEIGSSGGVKQSWFDGK